MNYATIKSRDIANGPGVRVSLFVSGCTHRCPGCFNEEAWDFDFGQPFTQEVIDRILEDLAPSFVRGLTLLGGEPFDPRNQGAIVELLRQIKAKYPEKSIWAFSGYLFDRDILPGKLGDPAITREYLSYLDVLVDGPFVQAKKNLTLRFRGSENQRLIDVPASLESGTVVLWEDWQGNGRGLK
jgi:anaerobic ribonucleoside-triphosphate reductase activating protein